MHALYRNCTLPAAIGNCAYFPIPLSPPCINLKIFGSLMKGNCVLFWFLSHCEWCWAFSPKFKSNLYFLWRVHSCLLILFKSIIINKMKRQSTEWETIFANSVTVKGWISKIFKQLIQLCQKEQTIQEKKQAENLNRHFSKEDTYMAKKHMKKYSASLCIREMQVKMTVGHHRTLVWTAIIKKSTNSKCWRGCGEKGTFLYF